MLSFPFYGCRFQFHFTFFALLAFCCVVAGIESGAFLLVAIIFHEFCHIFTMIFFHAPPEKITVSALGCHVQLPRGNLLSFSHHALVYLAGPCSNLFIAALLWTLGLTGHFLFSANLAMGVFHLLPIEPLDGGLALRAFLSWHLNPATAGRVTIAVSLILLFPLAILGFLVLLRTRYNFSLLAISLYLMLYLLLRRDDFSN